jgi:uncharacterized protein YneF (UPF0154 family)
MGKLNLTDKERRSVSVIFDVNRFVAELPGGVLIGFYYSQEEMDKEFRENDITVKSISSLAYTMMISGYGNKEVIE